MAELANGPISTGESRVRGPTHVHMAYTSTHSIQQPCHSLHHITHITSHHITQVTRVRLAHAPTHCLASGTSRAPKAPYMPLAVLGRCGSSGAESAAVGNGSERAVNVQESDERAHDVRSALQYQPWTQGGLIRTSFRLRALRQRLPEFGLECGFWPNCTGARESGWLSVCPKVASQYIVRNSQ